MSKVTFRSDTRAVWNRLGSVHGTLAFDIGANGGMVSTMLAEHFEQVVALEPCVESYAELVGEVPENVRALNVAVSDVTGEIELRETTLTDYLGELFTDETLPWGGHVGYRTVDAITLDDLSARYGWPDFIKIDTEGHEVMVLRGGSETLRHDPAFIIEVHSKTKGAECRELLASFGLAYEIHWHEAYGPASPHVHEHYWLMSPKARLQ